MFTSKELGLAQKVIDALNYYGANPYVVGGAVRDKLMDIEPNDIDILVTGMTAEEVEDTLRNYLPGVVNLTGKDFGVYRYRENGDEVEVALPRTERSVGDTHVEFDVTVDPFMDVEKDLARRDFTFNAMAWDILNGKLLDPFDGQQDIHDETIALVFPEAFEEDPLRAIRALVAISRYAFYPTNDTFMRMQSIASTIATNVSPERIQGELDKLFSAKYPYLGIRYAYLTGILKNIMPEVHSCFGFDQNNPHHEKELGEHLLHVLQRICEKTDDPDLRFAALLHDIGKPDSVWVDPDHHTNHYYFNWAYGIGQDHEQVGGTKAHAITGRLRYPVNRRNKIVALVDCHMWSPFTTKKGARKFLNKYDESDLEGFADDLLTLRWADQGGKAEYPSRDETFNLDTQAKLIEEVRSEGEATSKSGLAVNGHDLIEAGFEPGPQMGKILEYLTDCVIENPLVNDKARLIRLAWEMEE